MCNLCIPLISKKKKKTDQMCLLEYLIQHCIEASLREEREVRRNTERKGETTHLSIVHDFPRMTRNNHKKETRKNQHERSRTRKRKKKEEEEEPRNHQIVENEELLLDK